MPSIENRMSAPNLPEANSINLKIPDRKMPSLSDNKNNMNDKMILPERKMPILASSDQKKLIITNCNRLLFHHNKII